MHNIDKVLIQGTKKQFAKALESMQAALESESKSKVGEK